MQVLTALSSSFKSTSSTANFLFWKIMTAINSPYRAPLQQYNIIMLHLESSAPVSPSTVLMTLQRQQSLGCLTFSLVL